MVPINWDGHSPQNRTITSTRESTKTSREGSCLPIQLEVKRDKVRIFGKKYCQLEISNIKYIQTYVRSKAIFLNRKKRNGGKEWQRKKIKY